MSYEQIHEELKKVQSMLGDSTAYTEDSAMWEAVSSLAVIVGELAAKQHAERCVH